jgi:hypothetical protein
MDLSIMAICVENFQGPDCSQCSPGFTGTMCLNINGCIGVNCSGNGQCVDGVLSYTCDCDPGFTGVECNVNIDDCVPVNCSGNGQCVDGIDTYTCDCDPGFTGMECGINIDDCVGVNCSGNGQCVDGINSFSCNCNASFTGPLCETHASDVDSDSERFSASATFIGGILGVVLSFALLLALLIVLVMSVVMLKKHKVCYQGQETQCHVNAVHILRTIIVTHIDSYMGLCMPMGGFYGHAYTIIIKILTPIKDHISCTWLSAVCKYVCSQLHALGQHVTLLHYLAVL